MFLFMIAKILSLLEKSVKLGQNMGLSLGLKNLVMTLKFDIWYLYYYSSEETTFEDKGQPHLPPQPGYKPSQLPSATNEDEFESYTRIR